MGPPPPFHGNYTVYEGNLFDDQRHKGVGVIRLEEFPDLLARVFALAEGEIEKYFDLSSEKAMIQSILEKPIGVFPPTDILMLHILLGNPEFYHEIAKHYDNGGGEANHSIVSWQINI